MREEPLHLVYDIAYAMMRRFALRTEEEDKALRKLDDTLRSSASAVDDMPDWLGAFEVKTSD